MRIEKIKDFEICLETDAEIVAPIPLLVAARPLGIVQLQGAAGPFTSFRLRFFQRIVFIHVAVEGHGTRSCCFNP